MSASNADPCVAFSLQIGDIFCCVHFPAWVLLTDRKLYFLRSTTDHLWLHPGMKTQYISSWTSTLRMNRVHLKEREHIGSPASFKGDLWRYIAFNPNTDLVALWTVDIQRDICVIPFSNESLFPSPQFPSFSWLLTRALDWETDRTRNISSDVYTLLAQAGRDYGPLGFDEGPLHLPYLSSHRTNSPASVSKDWLSTYSQVYFLLPGRQLDWIHPGAFCSKEPWVASARWDGPKEPCQTVWRSEVVGANTFHFKFQIYIRPSLQRYDLVHFSVTFPTSDFNVTFSLCGSWALPVGLVELIVFWWRFRRWLTYLVDA